MGRNSHLCCLCSKLMFFKRSRVYCGKSNYAHKTSQKKACIRPCDTNNSTPSLHECTTILQTKVCIIYMVWKLVGHPPWVSYQFGFIRFSIWLQCKISESSVFSIFFPHKVFHHKARKVRSQFLKNKKKKINLGLAWRA